MATSKDIKTGTLHLRLYESTYTNAGRVAQNVWMDQYGRIMEKRTDNNGNTDWHPTGECGSPKH